MPVGDTVSVSGTFTVTGTASYLAAIATSGTTATQTTITNSGTTTISYAALNGLKFTGASVAAANSYDIGGNSCTTSCSTLTITPPTAGTGSGHIIGGWLLRRDIDGASNDNSLAWLSDAA